METHTALFHPDFHVVVVEEGGKVVKKTMDTRAIVTGHVEGQCQYITVSDVQCFFCCCCLFVCLFVFCFLFVCLFVCFLLQN